MSPRRPEAEDEAVGAEAETSPQEAKGLAIRDKCLRAAEFVFGVAPNSTFGLGWHSRGTRPGASLRPGLRGPDRL